VSGFRPGNIVKSVRGRKGHVQEHTSGDFEALFWFRRPILMLRVFQYAYFENALSLAVLVFAFWQDEHVMFQGAVSTGTASWRTVTTGVLIVADLLLLIYSSIFVLPVYALTTASANFGTPETLLKLARQALVSPEVVDFLARAHGVRPRSLALCIP
jgi:hypothetical protein